MLILMYSFDDKNLEENIIESKPILDEHSIIK